MEISIWIILGTIGAVVLYFYIIWLFLKSAIKSGVKEAVKEALLENQIRSLHSPN